MGQVAAPGFGESMLRSMVAVLRIVILVGTREVGLEAGPSRGVGDGVNHGGEDRFEEAVIVGERGGVVGGEGGFHGFFCGWRDEFDAANENASEFGGRGRDGEREDGVDEAPRNDIEDAGAVVEPGGFPGFEHGVGFVGEEALGDEELL